MFFKKGVRQECKGSRNTQFFMLHDFTEEMLTVVSVVKQSQTNGECPCWPLNLSRSKLSVFLQTFYYPGSATQAKTAFLESKLLSKPGDNKSQNSETQRTLIVRRFNSVLNTGAADSAVSKDTETPVVPQKRKTIPAPHRKPETSSFNPSNLNAKQQQRQVRSDPINLIKVNGPKMEDTKVVELPLQKVHLQEAILHKSRYRF
ncbi:unnamed protein product [Orchesella dallaii]|uniref:Uncharacterized protein n=1 Tax=Orchesella dallaii TaxID=48710 RepID=A0ABP1RKK3_9HEXA